MLVVPAEWGPRLIETYNSTSNEYVTIKYGKDPVENPHRFNYYNISDSPPESPETYKIISILSDQRKYLISTASKAISHNIQQDIPSIVEYAKKYPGMLAVIFEPEYAGMKTAISKYLTMKKIEYTFVPYDSCLHINNFFIVESFRGTLQSMRDSLEFIEYTVGVVDEEKSPNRKVYVSRSKTEKKYYRKDGELITLDKRIDDEYILENFFKSHGYEIVSPEDFSNIQEQMSYFRDVRVLIGLSGGGLTNHMFMQNGQTVVELATQIKPGYIPGVSKEETRSYHMEYIAMSYVKHHTYIVMPHNETAIDILRKFVDNSSLRSLLD